MKGKAVVLWHKTDLLIGELWVHLQDGGAFCPQGASITARGRQQQRGGQVGLTQDKGGKLMGIKVGKYCGKSTGVSR